MKKKSLTLDIPERLLRQLEAIARASKTELDDVVLQTLKQGMPPSLKAIPSKFHKDLLALNALGDLELWDIVSGKKRLGKKKKSKDNPEEEENVGSMKRAYAFSLLKWRGHPVPQPSDFLVF